MLDWTLLSPELIRKVTAEILLVFDVGLLVFIGAHLRREFRLAGFNEARKRLGNQAAIAVGVHTFGLMIIRAWNTYLYAQGHNASAAERADLIVVVVFGLALSVIGMACCIRIFSPARWGNRGWIVTFTAAAAFVGWMQAAG